MIDKQVDILIIGGGLTGATLLLALQNQGYETLLVESLPLSDKVAPDFDARTLALAPASVRLFQSLNLWSDLYPHVTPVNQVHVSEAGCFGATRLQGKPEKPLGYIIEMQYLNQTLVKHLPLSQVLAPAKIQSLEQNQVTIQMPDKTMHCKAKLIVAADGADSPTRQLSGLKARKKIWNQSAIVTNIALEKPHNGQAFERFTAKGALALLPVQKNKMALVWSLSTREAEKYVDLSDTEFLESLQTIFGYRLGRMTKAGKRSLWPLQQVVMPEQTAWPLVFIGNAAHTLHPVAAQGFNLGLRDIATLTECLIKTGLNPEMLVEYQRKRAHDQWVITQSTHILAELFTLKLPGLRPARNAGMLALDNLRPFKKIFSRYARGFGGYIPDLLCADSLREPDKS